MKKIVGSSHASARRRAIATMLSKRLRAGDREAAFRLMQRQRALKGIAMSGYHWRLDLANEARRRKHQDEPSDSEPLPISLQDINGVYWSVFRR